MVELMGGRIGVDSTPGVGSCFWFELDAAPPPLPDSAVPAHTVLSVDDDADRQQRLETLVAQLPSTCLLRARDIHAGIRMARSARPDVIVIGVRPSDPGGLEALRLLARHPSTTHIPVIALDADSRPGDAEAGLAAGYFRFLTPPIHGDAFLHALGLALDRRQPVGQSATAPESQPC